MTSPHTIRAAAALCLACASAWAQPETADPALADRPFVLMQEFYGADGYTDPQVTLNLGDRMMNGLAVWPPVEEGVRAMAPRVPNVMLRLPAGASPAGKTPAAIEQQRQALLQWAPPSAYWNLMPEWDQSGGAWVPKGRPSYRGLSRQAAYERFVNYYESTYPELMRYLQLKGVRRTATTVYAPNMHYGYELGAEVQMLERCIDELGDLATGVAFARGAGGQYNRPWGIDIASWRTALNSATRYEGAGIHRGGWSAGYLERHLYLSYAAGASLLHIEAVAYRGATGVLNPLGEAARRFADFALRRHPGLGVPAVRTALLLDHFSGFDPRHGVYNQANAVWNRDLEYSPGDHMIDNLLSTAYPGHWLHGLTPGAPFADRQGVPDPKGFADFLASGGDARPYEPMPTTRWGDSLDILTTRAPEEALKKYQMIVLAGDVRPDEQLRASLAQWTAAGGVLVVNAAQAGGWEAGFLGVTGLDAAARTGARFRWADEAALAERAFSYVPVRATEAEVWAVEDTTGDPLVTRRAWGRGEVILATPEYLQASDRSGLLQGGVQLLDRLMNRFAVAQVAGPPIYYVVGTPPGKLVVTLANTTGEVWRGTVTAASGKFGRVNEYVADAPLAFTRQGDEVRVNVTVPGYGVRVVAFENE